MTPPKRPRRPGKTAHKVDGADNSFANQATDLGSIRSAVVDASSQGMTLWTSYLGILFYILVTVGGVTHEQLFLEHAIKVPLFDVDLPLLSFAWVAPGVFLILHVFVLLNFYMLAEKVRIFDGALRGQVDVSSEDSSLRLALRWQLPSSFLVIYLAGPRYVREGLVGAMLGLIARISLVIAPLMLLALFQLKFLPYHGTFVTWWHRLAVFLDLCALILLWPRIVLPAIDSSVGKTAHWRTVATAIPGSVLMILLVFVATFPGELLHDQIPSFALRRLLVEGPINPLYRTLDSVWTNRLVLAGFDILDRAKLDETKLSRQPFSWSVRGKDLVGAILTGANLRKVDFTGAQLADADLRSADLRDSTFQCADADETNIAYVPERCANLTRTDFSGAKLQNAYFRHARMQEATFKNADASGAILDYAYAPGANFVSTKLKMAQLTGADLRLADFEYAQSEGANFERADLRLASFASAILTGADLDSAVLGGANFYQTDLEGAWFQHAQLDAVYFSRPNVWRIQQLDLAENALILNVSPRTADGCPKGSDWQPQPKCPTTIGWYNGLLGDLTPLARTMNTIDQSTAIANLERIIWRLDPSRDLTHEVTDRAGYWPDHEGQTSNTDELAKSLIGIFAKIGCPTERNREFLAAQVTQIDANGLLRQEQTKAAAIDALLNQPCVTPQIRAWIQRNKPAAALSPYAAGP